MSNRTMKLCSIDSCTNKHYARGWCRSHYERWSKHGDPLKVVRFDSPELAFEARTEPIGDCLIWVGAKHPAGYGQMRINKKIVPAHRYAWEVEHGPIPEGMEVDHRDHCNPACVQVSHLRLATKSENGLNRSGASSHSKSGFRNVVPYGNRWKVVLVKNGKQSHWGVFETIEEAAAVAEQSRKDLFGEFAGRG